MFKKFIDALYPPSVTCIVCSDELKSDIERERNICEKCHESFYYIGGRPIKIEHNGFAFNELYCLYIYEGAVKKMVLNFKDSGGIYLAEHIAMHLNKELRKCADVKELDAITYIPTGKRKQKKRGYDPMQEIALCLSRLTNIPIGSYLAKKDSILDQTEIQNRFLNIQNAFYIKESPAEKRLLIIDDVFNSGATLSEASAVLHIGGAKCITALTFCVSPSFARTLSQAAQNTNTLSQSSL